MNEKKPWPRWRKEMIRERKSLPVIPPLPPSFPPSEPNPPVAVCGECGLEIRRVMMYCCMNARCPVQTRVTL